MERVTGPQNILPTDSDEKLKTALNKAKQVLLSGGVVAYPTESFYGLAVDIENSMAIDKLFALKQRDKNNPVLIILPGMETLDEYVDEIPVQAQRLITEFWPGGLTMLFRAGSNISPLLTANTGKIGIRYSSHPVATALAGSIGRPVTGTSSNISGHAPCIMAEEVFNYFGSAVDLILDSGPAKGGPGSTILDVTVDPCVVIREGMVSKKDIERVVL